MRFLQLAKASWLKYRKTRDELAKLRGQKLVLQSRRTVQYQKEATRRYLHAERNENKLNMAYYLGQMRLVNWLLGSDKEPTLND